MEREGRWGGGGREKGRGGGGLVPAPRDVLPKVAGERLGTTRGGAGGGAGGRRSRSSLAARDGRPRLFVRAVRGRARPSTRRSAGRRAAWP